MPKHLYFLFYQPNNKCTNHPTTAVTTPITAPTTSVAPPNTTAPTPAATPATNHHGNVSSLGLCVVSGAPVGEEGLLGSGTAYFELSITVIVQSVAHPFSVTADITVFPVLLASTSPV